MDSKQRKHFDEDDVVRSGEGEGASFAEVVERTISRRAFLGSGIAAGFMLTGSAWLDRGGATKQALSPTGLNFIPIKPSTQDALVIAENYTAQTVVRWGDPMKPSLPPFNVESLTASYQAQAFGYNNDFLGYLPIPFGSKNSSHGLLAVNFEYANFELMFPVKDAKDLTKEHIDICLEGVGFGVVEIKKENKKWEVVLDSSLNRRYSATTPMKLSGPAAGLDRMKTSIHKEGRTCTGTFANCAAGKTPWGTILSAEENFQGMFGNANALTDSVSKKSADRYGLGKKESEYGWERFYPRFDCARESNEANHFGWVVEFDPYDPDWVPVKRTSLGRCRHEAATIHVTKSGQVVMYSGDDARFEYVYKFVCSKKYDPANRTANRGILDEGTLYVARFNDDGTGDWLPLIFGQGPLTPANGFQSQGDVVIDARIAGDLVGATKMDRPEDIEVNPVNQKVYIVCTNNTDRGKEGKEKTDKANPRPENRHGHIIELTEAGDDHAATSFQWGLFLVCGDPKDAATFYAGYPKEQVSPISCPDNICFDAAGNLWIATDGQERAIKFRDGFFAVPTSGPDRGRLKQFMASVIGSEVCGPEFTPDGKTAFLAIQHPGEGSTYDNPSTRWPDGQGVPRPSVIAIEANNGEVVGARGA